jgi:dethiobiotin synthetase
MRSGYFITAIDTDAGKTVATGSLARYLQEKGWRVITQKMAQTGCTEASEDIETHRRIMGVADFPEDRSGLTCPYLFPFPAAPQLSARMAGQTIDLEKIREATLELEKKYDCVLTEGVGGLMVPLTDDRTVLDYMTQWPQPTILIATGKLGSVNHTLLSLEVLKKRGIELIGLIYNRFIETDPTITADTFDTLRRFLKRYYPEAALVEMPRREPDSPVPDFSELFGL